MALLNLIINSTKAINRTPLTINSLLKNRAFTTCSALFSQKEQNISSFMPNDPGDWKHFYKFPYIKGLASANKLKMYQVIFTSAAIPASFALPNICDPLVVTW